ncbi:MAG: hypothetical protein AB7F20_04220 [Geoalkalibacter sp.]
MAHDIAQKTAKKPHHRQTRAIEEKIFIEAEDGLACWTDGIRTQKTPD